MTDYIELAQRAVNCRKWRWVDGMIAVSDYVTLDKRLPDLTHPATMGCLVALVREAWKVPDLAAIRSAFKDGSVVWSFPITPALKEELGLTGGYLGGATEAEALVAALEAANGR
jgi:hypothetical protein